MSDDNLKAFLDAIANDPELLMQLKDPSNDPSVIAASLGIQLSREDWLAYQESPEWTLSDEELEGVVGGTVSTHYNTQCQPGCTNTQVVACNTKVVGCMTKKGWTC